MTLLQKSQETDYLWITKQSKLSDKFQQLKMIKFTLLGNFEIIGSLHFFTVNILDWSYISKCSDFSPNLTKYFFFLN